MCKPKIAISFTPRIPGPIYIVVMLTVAFMPISTTLPAQSITLDSLSVYEASYRSYMQQRWRAERTEFTVTTRKKWWYYLPSLGWSLKSPQVVANTGILAQIDRDKLTMRARLASLDARYELEFKETLQRIRHEYQKLLVQRTQMERSRRLLVCLRQIQAIHTEAATNPTPTMTPEQRINSQHGYELAVAQVQDQVTEWELAVLTFFELCRYELPDLPLVPVADAECILRSDWRQSTEPLIEVASFPAQRNRTTD